MKFKAAILTGIGKPLEIKEVSLYEGLKPGQILVRHIVSEICAAQQQEIDGYKNPKLLPRLLGHSSKGIVADVGVGVKKVQIGDQVCCHWRKSSGMECDFPKYSLDGRSISSGLITTFSEYSILSENRLTKIKDSVPDDLVGLMGCALLTALGTVNHVARIKFGESVLVIGAAGGVGMSLVAACKLAGGIVTGVDVRNDGGQVTSFGCRFVKSVESELFDVIISTVGDPKVIKQYFSNLSQSGRFILIGQCKPNEDIIIPNGLNMFGGDGQKFIVSEGGSVNPDYDLNRYLESCLLYLPWKNLISNRFKLDDINKGFQSLRDNAGRNLLIL